MLDYHLLIEYLISSTQIDRRNYLLACQKKGKSHLLFLPRLLTFCIFLFGYLFILY